MAYVVAMSTEPRDKRVPFMMSASELEALDEWCFRNRVRVRADAIRTLIKVGMTTVDHIREAADGQED